MAALVTFRHNLFRCFERPGGLSQALKVHLEFQKTCASGGIDQLKNLTSIKTITTKIIKRKRSLYE